jgi:hypothetical protein
MQDTKDVVLDGKTFTIDPCGDAYRDDDGCSLASLYTIRFEPDGLTLEGPDPQNKFISAFFPSDHCQHSYDCCAKWYPDRGEMIHVDDIYGYAIVLQHWHLNV